MNAAFHPTSGGFVYYMHDASAAFGFRLAGDLSLEATQDLEQARLTACSIIGRRYLIVDLTGLTSIDAAGCELLKGWQGLGAQMTVLSGKEQARIQLMSGIPVTIVGAKPRDAKWLAPRVAALLLAALLALLFAATAVAGNSTLNARRRPRSAGMSAIVTMRARVSEWRSVRRGML
jgi:hypothetical protein